MWQLIVRLSVVVSVLLVVATPSMAARDPHKCGITVVRRALAKYKEGKRGYFNLPKGCATFIVPQDFHTRNLNNGAGVGIFHNSHPETWIAAIMPPNLNGIVKMNNGSTALWRDGELVGTLKEEK